MLYYTKTHTIPITLVYCMYVCMQDTWVYYIMLTENTQETITKTTKAQGT